MALTVSFLGLLGAILLLAYQYLIYPAFLSPLSKLPRAHWSCVISSLWWRRVQKQKRRLKTLYDVHQKHGDIVLMAPAQVSIVSMDGLRQVYTAGMEKDRWYQDEFMNYGIPNLVSMLDHKTHSAQKRIISSVYAKSYIFNSQDYVSLCQRFVTKKFLPIVDDLAVNQAPMNVLLMFQWAGGDLMSAYLFGTANGTNFMEERETREKYFGVDIKARYDENKPFMEQLFMERTEATLRDLDQEPEGATKPVSLAKLYRGLEKSDSLVGKSEDNIVRVCASEMLDHHVAAHETTGITLTYVFWRLSQDLALQARLREELLALSPVLPGVSDGPNAPLPSPSDIDALPLLHAILFETMRVNTVSPSLQPRIVGKGGTTIHGYYIPEGTPIAANAYTLHRHEETYPDPFEWKPERWMPNDDGEVEKGLMRWFWAFGSGGRMCIGSNYAISMLKLLMATVYTNYTTSIVDDEGIEQADDFISGPVGNKLILKFHRVK